MRGRTPRQRRVLLAGVGGYVLTSALLSGGNFPERSRFAVTTTAAVVGLVVVLLAVRPSTAVPTAWGVPLMVTVVLVAVTGCIEAFTGAVESVRNPQIACRDDTAIATVAGGALVRSGSNPYTTYDEVAVWVARCGHPARGSPLRVGRFAGRTDYPTDAEISAAAEAAFTSRVATSEIERRFAYPAGTALLGLGGEVELGLVTIVALALAFTAVIRRAGPDDRTVTAVALLAQVPALAVLGSGHAEGVVIGLLAAAWAMPDRRAGGVLLGICCAIKQTAWLAVPALLATAWVRGGWPAALRVAASSALTFTAINLPFVVLAPQAWLRGVLSPGLDPLFPAGTGVVSLVTNHVLPWSALTALSPAPFVLAMAAAVMAVRTDRHLPGGAAIVAALALWTGTRSLPQYFLGVGIIAVTVVAVGRTERPSTPLENVPAAAP